MAIAELLSELVRIPSVNPLHAGERSGTGGEAFMSAWLAKRCTEMGADVETEEVEPGRHNVYALFEGSTQHKLAIDVHLDTVGVEHMTGDPFDGAINADEQRVYGRGAVDTKATLAVVLSVLGELITKGEKPIPTVELVGTISEESGGLLGAGAYRDRLLAKGEVLDQLIVAEPTMCESVYGHKGGFGMELVVDGKAAHSSAPQLGINAITAAARVVECVEQEQQRLAGASDGTGIGKILGPGTISVTEISGGRARNIIPDRCELFVGRRIVDGEDPLAEFKHVTELICAAALPAQVSVVLSNDSVSAAFVETPDCGLIQALTKISGQPATVAKFGSNALRYREVAKEIVVFGPGSIDQAHSEVEWINISQLEKAVEIYRELLSS